MSTTLAYSDTLVVESCWCGIHMALPRTLMDFHRRQRDNNIDHSIYCPLGHHWQLAGKSALDRERERAQRLERELANSIEDTRIARAETKRVKTAATKAANRASKGVCPHPECKRSFVDVARHVRTKHPELVT